MATYDPAQHHLVFLGNLFATGFGKDTFLKVSRENDSFTKTIGVDGGGAWTKSNDRSGTIEVTFLASSLSNDVMTAILLADELGGNQVGPVEVIESNGTSVSFGTQARLRRPPDLERAKELGEVTWVIDVLDLTIKHGGLP